MKQYPFTNAGVGQWQVDYRNTNCEDQLQETLSIEVNFLTWLRERFSMSEAELKFISNLRVGFLHDVQNELVMALRQGVLIELIMEKPPVRKSTSSDDAGDPQDTVKYAELEKKRKEQEGENPPPPEPPSPTSAFQMKQPTEATAGHLILRSYYVLKPK